MGITLSSPIERAESLPLKFRISPVQPERSPLYSGRDLPASLLNFLLQGSSPPPEVKHVSDHIAIGQMASGQLSIQLLRLLIQLMNARRVLEIGTFIGITTLAMAEAAGDGAQIVTIEIGAEFSAIARKNFADHPAGTRVRSIHGDAFEVLPQLAAEQPFDLVFLDGAKQIYDKLFEASAPLLRPGGLFVVDDVCFTGDALNDLPATDKGEGAKRVVARVTGANGWLTCLLPVDDGMLLAVKPQA
jgi:predicted O-methyltransferase YrrM